ncbi:uncharacterized protein LOC128221673 [Mya arenaria]|uniref:uncharacterized protein LOC128221673 n=1 Tax=Mya arenaria TaxID=6604 RepID=UPI0022E94A00|nr:uncharacterized protein LOC128221673 [Mya arenaria]XP_052786244.1 uncharacterized protein LOC128221673 [Mya arenaria]
MENLQERLLEHVVPDQVGQIGKVHYSFTEMRIVHVHWPKVNTVDGLFTATNGALRLQGKYEIHRQGVLGYHKVGEFVFDLSAIALTIKENTVSEATAAALTERHRHRQHHHRPRAMPHSVTCAVGHIKVRFHGGAARLCQFLTAMYIKVYRRHLEAQITKVIQEAVQDDGQILMSALSVMASMHGAAGDRATETITVQTTCNTRVRETGTIQRFLDSFGGQTPPT